MGDEANFIVFPPFYPFTIRLVNLFALDSNISALLVSNISFIFLAIVFYKYLSKKFNSKIALRTVTLLSVFPTSYFFSAAYPESLFLLLTVSCLIFFDQKKYFLSGLLGGLSYLTRPFGLFLLPSLIIGLLFSGESKKLHRTLLFALPFIILICTYLALNKFVYNDFFAFSNILKNHWQKEFEWPWIGIYNSYHIAISGFSDYTIYLGWAEIIASIIGWIFVPIVFRKTLLALGIYYSLLGILVAKSTNFIMSTPRYLLSIFPVFIGLSFITQKKLIFIPTVVLSVALFYYLTSVFVKGQWAF